MKTKINKLKEDEKIIEKNLIVKNKYWTLEGCMKVLLEDGCNPNITNKAGETLLINSIKNKKVSTIKLLLENDCQVTTKNEQSISPIGQALMSMNHEALIMILETDEGINSVHEPQISDKQVAHKLLSPLHYLCKLIRLNGLRQEYDDMIDTLLDPKFNIICKDNAEKQGVFRQFSRLFSTKTADMTPETLYNIMEKYAKF